MYLVDTNIHAAFLLQGYEDDTLTRRYLELYDGISLAERVVPDFILGEFETFMMQVVPSRYGLNLEDKQKLKEVALDYIYKLTHECTIVVPGVKTVQRARDIYFESASSHYMSFVDCLVLATAEEHGFVLLTKDKRMSVAVKRLGVECFEPQV